MKRQKMEICKSSLNNKFKTQIYIEATTIRKICSTDVALWSHKCSSLSVKNIMNDWSIMISHLVREGCNYAVTLYILPPRLLVKFSALLMKVVQAGFRPP